MKRYHSVISLLILLFLFSQIFVSQLVQNVKATEWLTGYSYRRSLLITNSSASAGTNYQVRIIVKNGTSEGASTTYVTNDTMTINNKTRADFGDINYTDSTGNVCLDYWIENRTLNSGVNATFWIEVSGNLTASSQTIYLYYGSASQTTYSNGPNTMLFFDEFDGSTLDANKWTDTATTTVASSWVTVASSSGTWKGIRSKFSTVNASRLVCYGQLPDKTAGKYELIGFVDAAIVQYAMVYSCSGTWYSSFENVNYHDQATTLSTSAQRYEIKWSLISSNQGEFRNYMGNTLVGEENQTGVGVNHTPISLLNVSLLVLNTASVKADWVFVSRFVEPEPTFSTWGIEETILVEVPPVTPMSGVTGICIGAVVASVVLVGVYVGTKRKGGEKTE